MLAKIYATHPNLLDIFEKKFIMKNATLQNNFNFLSRYENNDPYLRVN